MAGTEQVDAIKELVLWARSEGILLAEVELGGISLSLQDTRVKTVPMKDGKEDVRTIQEKWADDTNVRFPREETGT